MPLLIYLHYIYYLLSSFKPFFNIFAKSAVDPTNSALFTVEGPFDLVSSSTSFNVNVSEYANLVALESAEARTAKAVAEKIVLKLGGWHKPMAQ